MLLEACPWAPMQHDEHAWLDRATCTCVGSQSEGSALTAAERTRSALLCHVQEQAAAIRDEGQYGNQRESMAGEVRELKVFSAIFRMHGCEREPVRYRSRETTRRWSSRPC